METIEQVIDGTLDYGNSISCTLSRKGDLLTNAYIRYIPSDLLNTSDGYEHIASLYDTDGRDQLLNVADHTVASEWMDQNIYKSNFKLFPRFSTGLLKEIQIEIGGQRNRPTLRTLFICT